MDFGVVQNCPQAVDVRALWLWLRVDDEAGEHLSLVCAARSRLVRCDPKAFCFDDRGDGMLETLASQAWRAGKCKVVGVSRICRAPGARQSGEPSVQEPRAKVCQGG